MSLKIEKFTSRDTNLTFWKRQLAWKSLYGLKVYTPFKDFKKYPFYLFFQLRYGEPTIRRAVPLALAMLSVSNPKLNILDTLSKFSHDSDAEVAHNSIFAMGMVGAGNSIN